MNAQSSTEPDAPERGRTFFGQPFVLANLFGVEMWERFSFYGMQGILLIYLYYPASEGGLGIDKGVATGIVGAYGGLVYLSTIVGGWVADRLIGAERTLFYAAVLVMVGHATLALFPGIAGLTISLLLIALGSGGVKANASSLVGSLYSEGDERRDAGFSVFYMGINLGAFVGPLLTGFFQETWGFHVGFGLAAVGMAFGLIQYSIGRRRLPAQAHVVSNPLDRAGALRYLVAAFVVVALIVALVAADAITAGRLSRIVSWTSALVAVALFVIILSSRRISAVERSRTWSMVPMFICSAVFWSLYQQQFTVVTEYSDERLDRNILGWEMPVSWVTSINPVFIIIFAGVFAEMWTKLGPRQPSTPVKFGLGTIIMGIAFLCFLLTPPGENTVPVMELVGILLLFTFAELLLSPVGLSLSTKLAPAVFTTQMVALFYLSVALGSAMSGTLGSYYDPTDEKPFFLSIGLAAIVVGVLMLVFTKPIRKLMAGVH